MYTYNWLDAYLTGGGYSAVKTPRTSSKDLVDEFTKYGWRASFVKGKKIHRLDDETLEGHHEREIVLGLARVWIEQTDPTASPTDRLAAIGLRRNVAQRLTDIITPLMDTSYTDEQVLEIGIEYLVGKYAPLTDGTVAFPMEPATVNIWMPYKTSKVMNIPASCSVSLQNPLQQILTKTPRNGNHSQFFFHTTSWRSAFSIIREINHTRGRMCQDFGIHPGFYLSDSLQTALDWGEKCMRRFTNEIATVVFSIPKTLPKHLNHKHLEGDEWAAVTYASRQCKDKDEEDIESIQPYKILTGYMVQNPNGVKKRDEVPKPHAPPKFQLVSRHYFGDAYLQTRIVGCFFFRRDA